MALPALLAIQAQPAPTPLDALDGSGIEAGLAQAPAPLAGGAERNWLADVQANIEASEYEIRWQPAANAYQSPNRAQNLRFTYFDDGFAAEPRAQREQSAHWKVKIALESFGRPEDTVAIGPVLWTISGNQAVATTEGLRFEYANDRRGMRQNFVVSEKPDGHGRLILNLRTELQGITMTVHPERAVVSFVRDEPGGTEVMRYFDLKVWDAGNRTLPASLEAVAPGQFAIVVDDSTARYPIVIDPCSSSPSWTGEGNQTSAWYGCSVSTAGDVNGDGYSDVIVGASEYDNGQTSEGRVFVYHGSASGLATSPSWTAEADWAYSNMGNSVASAGDVNGDGYGDIIVGALRYTYSGHEGAAFIWLGGSSGLGSNGTPANADWNVTSSQSYDHLGYAVASAGDVNGDGYSDVIVATPDYSSTYFTYDGVVYVFHGTSTIPSGTPSKTYYGQQDYANFGASVSTAGDVNGDGYSDIIVSAPGYDGGNTDEGRVFVYHGSSTGLSSSANWTADADVNQAYLGGGVHAVSTAGDLNGDGFGDIIVGCHKFDDGPNTDEGRAFVWLGSSTGLGSNGTPSNSDWLADVNDAGALLGSSVNLAGDVNGDGYSDIIVGAPKFDNGQSAEGMVFLWMGSVEGLGDDGTFDNADWSAEKDTANAWFGQSVASAGDVNGDGFSDVIVGAYLFDNGHTDEGGAFVYHGCSEGLSDLNIWSTESNQSDAELGWSVASAGDINGDGFSDVIVGAHLFDNGQSAEGRAFVFNGGTGGPSGSPWTAESDFTGAQFGFSVASAGDVNGDGYGDIIVGAPVYSNGQTAEGRAFVWHGSSSGLGSIGTPSNADWKAEANQDSASLGNSVGYAGDVNGDGYGDIIVGALNDTNGQSAEGRVFVWHGSSTGLGTDGTPANADWKAESNLSSSQFGVSVAGAGDVNRDGYSDIIVGANVFTSGENQEGKVFVWHGSSSGLGSDGTPSNSDWTAEGNQIGGDFGWSVASAGDVNGDGYSDVIIGAPLYTDGQSEEGHVFVWHGGSSGLGTGSPNATFFSNQEGAHLGVSVASAGDVNGDGFSDVIMGADTFANTLTDEGLALVFHGSASGLETSFDWPLVGGQEGAKLGRSVAGAGDVNGDGYSDVIVGANLFDNGQGNEGAAFVFLGNGGDGIDMPPRQWRTDLSTPVVAPLRTASTSQAGLGLTGRTFYGRGDVKVQFEVKALGTAFNGSSLTETSSWTDTGTGGSAIDQTISSLSNNTFYKWRARIKYRPSDRPVQPFSHWFFIPANGLTESDFQVKN